MKNLLIMLLIMFFSIQAGYCGLDKDGINIYNLKKNNSYILTLETRAEKIDISDKRLLSIMPVSSIYNDGKQLFIEAVDNGVCDVNIKTAENNYKVRFVTGTDFQDNKNDIYAVDIPFE